MFSLPLISDIFKTALAFIVISDICKTALAFIVIPLLQYLWFFFIKSPITDADICKVLYWIVNMTLQSCSVVYWSYEYECMSLVTSDKGFFTLPQCPWPSIRADLVTLCSLSPQKLLFLWSGACWGVDRYRFFVFRGLSFVTALNVVVDSSLVI